MSGHSKWSQIKRQKGVADVKRGNLFTKLSNNITLAAKTGGGLQETNFRLRLAVDLARNASMPKENIERAIKRGTGELGGNVIEEVMYEGYGPTGIAVLVQVLTENKNRTAPIIRNIFSKHGGNMGQPGSVAWMFAIKGVLRLEIKQIGMSKDELELMVIDAGAEDVIELEEHLTIICPMEQFESLKKQLEQKNIAIEYAEVEYIAKQTNKIEDAEVREKLDALYEELESSDDVNNYYTNEK